MKGVYSVFTEYRSEKLIERSRFISTCLHVESEEEARAFLARVRTEFPDATHHCYAFVADTLGNLMRFSDDGEPQGTAGMPILDALRGKKLYQTAVVVTRYFGGVKLGAGGLVRAYSGAASECLDGAEKRFFEPCARYMLTLGYELSDAVRKYISANGWTLADAQYSDCVRLTVAVRSREEEAFAAKIVDFTAGRVRVEKQDEFIFAFASE